MRPSSGLADQRSETLIFTLDGEMAWIPTVPSAPMKRPVPPPTAIVASTRFLHVAHGDNLATLESDGHRGHGTDSGSFDRRLVETDQGARLARFVGERVVVGCVASWPNCLIFESGTVNVNFCPWPAFASPPDVAICPDVVGMATMTAAATVRRWFVFVLMLVTPLIIGAWSRTQVRR